MAGFGAKGLLAGGILAGIGASVCCVGPLLLLALGIGGAWVGTLTALAPLRPILIAATLLLLVLAWRQLYRGPRECAPDTACAAPRTLVRQRCMFWLGTVLVLGLLAVPEVAPLFL